MKNTYNVYMLGTKIATHNAPRLSLQDIIKRRENAERNARLVNIFTR